MSEVALRDLDAVIDQCLEFGMTPEEIRDQLPRREGEEWLNAEILARRDDFVFTIARQRERSRTRAVERNLHVQAPRTREELMISKLRFPNEDGSWSSVRYGDGTEEQFRRRAAFDWGIGVGILRTAIFHDACADRIKAEGVRTLGEVKGELPALPSVEDVRELIAS